MIEKKFGNAGKVKILTIEGRNKLINLTAIVAQLARKYRINQTKNSIMI